MNFQDLMKQAYRYGEKNSHDTSTRLGALLVEPANGYIKMKGANRYLSGAMENDPQNHERPRKYAYIEHAERDVLYQCWNGTLNPRGLIMVAPWACCADCARAIAYSGVTLLVVHKQACEKAPDRWKESIEFGWDILAKRSVAVYQWDGEVGDCANLFNGEEWRP